MFTVHFKITYDSIEDEAIMHHFIRQANHIYRSAVNRLLKGSSVTFKDFDNYNDINLLDSWIKNSEVHAAKDIVKSFLERKKSEESQSNKKTRSNIIFGGRYNFMKRQKLYKGGKKRKKRISKEEFKKKTLTPLYVLGEKDSGTKKVHGNRHFKIQDDLESVIFKYKDSNTKKYNYIRLNLPKLKDSYRKDLIRILYHQQQGDMPITYRLTIYNELQISCDEENLYSDIKKTETIENRICSLDLNPNYIGMSIVDWSVDTSEDKLNPKESFKVVYTRTYSLKKINDIDNQLAGSKVPSTDPKRIYINNKRNYELLEISKQIFNLTKHYHCEMFAVEDLNMKSSDRKKGKKFNKLTNNMWIRTAFVNNLQKRCAIYGVRFYKVKCAYSSFVGNFLYRNCKEPDMVLAAIEISRRCFEIYHKLIKKDVYCPSQKDNNGKRHYDTSFIIQPKIHQFMNQEYIKSLEEFGIEDCYSDFVSLYKAEFKESKRMYRLSLDKLNLKFSRMCSDKSLVTAYQNCQIQ